MTDRAIDSELIKHWLVNNLSESNVVTDDGDLGKTNQSIVDSMDVTFKKLDDHHDLRQTELRSILSGKSILQKFRKILQVEIRDWSLLPILEKQTFFNLNLISVFSSIVKKQNSMHADLDGIQSTQNSMHADLDGIQSTQNSMHADLDGIQSTQNSMHADLDGIQSTQNSMHADLDGIQSTQNSMHAEFSNNLSSIKNSSYNTNIGPENLNYGSFADHFRGIFDDIINLQSSYLPYIIKSNDSIPSGLFVDIGSGRGEFLELLSKLNIPCQGIETDSRMLEICISRGNTNVQNVDGLDFLRESDNDSFKGITLFQVIEHFNAESMIHLIHQSFRTLKNKGVLILETVNPDSLFSLMSFWKDPTHMHPIPPDVLKFYLEMAGFVNVKVIFNSPVPDHERLEGSDKNTEKLNNILFGPRDYAVIGWK